MTITNQSKHIEKRRTFRKEQTPEEELLWQMLRGNKTGFKWRRQVSIGAYIADFYCFAKKLVIELDGNQHLEPKALEYDKIRDAFLSSLGIRVIRISNNDLRRETDTIYQMIINHLNA